MYYIKAEIPGEGIQYLDATGDLGEFERARGFETIEAARAAIAFPRKGKIKRRWKLHRRRWRAITFDIVMG